METPKPRFAFAHYVSRSKVLRIHGQTPDVLSEKHYKRLHSEILIWSSLNHPNIAHLHGFTKPDQPDDMPTIISQWYTNSNIIKWLMRNTTANRMLLLRDISSSIVYLHSQYIVHGDIKGENVLIDDSQNPRLIDFGLAHFVDVYARDLEIAVALSSVHLGGTLRFSSPELLESGRSTDKSDLWALGCLATQLLTNQIPYGWSNNVYFVNRIIMSPFNIDAFSPRNDLEHQLLGIISRCWAEDPNNRPSAAQFLGSIDKLIEGGLQISTPLPMRESH
ncbi:hypothetical protein FRC03_007314 [Tulasnella sp. 419]|nr:hypothetical protein FRC03_007314 [Tulasnella sp. 419]